MVDERQNLASAWRDVDRMAVEVAALGRAAGLPLTAGSSNLANPLPMRDASGAPYAETVFDWVETDPPYWRNRRLALNQPILNAVRITAEPFYFQQDRLVSWRRNAALSFVDVSRARGDYGVAAALVAPVHLPFGVLGAVVWGCATPLETLPNLFAERVGEFLALAIRFVGAHAELSGLCPTGALALTPREVQCLRWTALGKADNEIAIILDISIPTVRFHLKNAAQKLGASSRSHAIYRATALGYVTTSH